MLFNKSTGKPRTIPAISRECSPDTDILTLDSLIAWLEQRPADGIYNYSYPTGCLLYQYFKAKGLTILSVVSSSYTTRSFSGTEERHSLPAGWSKVALGSKIGYPEWTYGAALQRARALKYGRAA